MRPEIQAVRHLLSRHNEAERFRTERPSRTEWSDAAQPLMHVAADDSEGRLALAICLDAYTWRRKDGPLLEYVERTNAWCRKFVARYKLDHPKHPDVPLFVASEWAAA